MLLSLTAYSTIFGQAPLLQNVSARKTISLDGVWDSQVDVILEHVFATGSLVLLGCLAIAPEAQAYRRYRTDDLHQPGNGRFIPANYFDVLFYGRCQMEPALV